MNFLRSRGLRRAFAWSPFVGCIAVVLVYAAINAYGRWKFDKTMDALVARGYHRTEAEAIGPLPPDSENLLKHPAVLAELSAKEAERIFREEAPGPFAVGASPSDEVEDEGTTCLTWIGEMKGLGVKVGEITGERERYAWSLKPEQLRGPEGRKAAIDLMVLYSPYESRRRAMIEAISHARPACAAYQIQDDNDDALHVLLNVSRFFIDRGEIATAAGRKPEAVQDYTTALRNIRGMQTLAISQWHADAAISQMQDLVRVAFMDVPAGYWTEDELRSVDAELEGLGEGRLMMEFQRLHVSWIVELHKKLQEGEIPPPKRIDWEEWQATWEWSGESLVEHAKMVWLGVRPHGLEDLETAAKLERLVRMIEEIGGSPDWQHLLAKLPVPEEYSIGNADFGFERPLYFSAEIAEDLVEGPAHLDDLLPEHFNNERAYTEGVSAKGHVWIAMARWVIALERHRLRHDSHPASLDVLDADFRSGLPVDPISRKPFSYRLAPDGGFELEGAKPSWDPESPMIWRRRLD